MNNFKKELKPFKQGATYKLRPEYCNIFGITNVMQRSGLTREMLTEKGITIGECSSTAIYVGAVSHKLGFLIILKEERYMFKRIDNKEKQQ